MSSEDIRDGFMPWAGLALGTAGFFLTHQIGSDSEFQNCRPGSPSIVILGAFLGLCIIALGALGSWRVYGAQNETPSRRLVAIVSLLASALFVIGVTLPLMAALVIPGCFA